MQGRGKSRPSADRWCCATSPCRDSRTSSPSTWRRTAASRSATARLRSSSRAPRSARVSGNAMTPRTRVASLAIASLLLLGRANGTAQTIGSMYDRAMVAREQPRLAARIDDIWTKAFLPQLTAEEQRALSGVTFRTPLEGDPVLGYYSESRSRVVTMPAISLLFYEDLCTAYAWLQRRGYRLETVEEYVAMLKYKRAAAFGGRYPPPLTALGIPADALTDAGVNDLSLRFRNTGYAFILAHELGHVRFQHGGYAGVPITAAQANEAQADEFALELMRRVSEIPMGAMIFFQAGIYYFENRADFPSDAARSEEHTSEL